MISRDFWYARHDFPLRGINFSSCRTIKISTPVGVDIFMVRPTRFAPPGHKLRTVSGNKNAHPGGVGILMVRPTRFERATYRVGVFRRILIKCCVFKGCAVFTDNTRFLWISRKPLKTLGKLAFSISSAIVVKQ